MLRPCFPNPFNPKTTIRFDLPKTNRVVMDIYDVRGRLVRNLTRGEELSSGSHTIDWNGTDATGQAVAAGVYLVRIEVGTFSEAKTVVLVKQGAECPIFRHQFTCNEYFRAYFQLSSETSD